MGRALPRLRPPAPRPGRRPGRALLARAPVRPLHLPRARRRGRARRPRAPRRQRPRCRTGVLGAGCAARPRRQPRPRRRQRGRRLRPARARQPRAVSRLERQALAPRALGPFDYGRENYTRELWIAEGFTSYYDGLLVLRSGEISVKAHLQRLAESIGRLRDTPGRLVQSLEDSSFDAWIKLYRPQDDSPNASVSYYLKGSLVALLLDLWLRELRPSGSGLDGVLAELWQRGPGRLETRGPTTSNTYSYPGFTVEDLEQILGEQSGLGEVPGAIRALWSKPVELDFASLAQLGLRLSEKPVQPGLIDLGFTLQDRAGSPWVEFVRTDSPAERAGLASGDELLAARRLDGSWLRLRSARAARVWDHLQPGAPAELLISRRERVLTLPIAFAAARGAPQIERIGDADPAARARFEAWSGRRWSDP
ncbi:hypothetical protein [Nannocystis pusilla]|uniref:M61 family metallopeptidase n=1 Tax=Nannocystis pusilla TaxID=889268 RepID=UPI003B78881D